MDAVTAFSLASSIISVVDVSVKLMKKCREIYEEGSTRLNRETEEIARYLSSENATLEESMTKALQSQLQIDREITELSTKVSETAQNLLKELERLKTGSKRKVFATARKLAKTTFKGEYLKETQKKLDKYREVLEFKILQRLDFRSLKLREDFQELDDRVQRLAISLNDGHNSLERIVVSESQMSKDSIIQFLKDRDKDREAATVHNQQLRKLRKSLWFPEIAFRQEDISEAHPGTCEWLLQDDLRYLATEASPREMQHEFSQVDTEEWALDPNLEEELFESRIRFLEWLVNGNDMFWFTGKAGSGKSTLMKNLASHRKTEDYLKKWAGDADLLTPSPSFYFLELGSSSLQKNLRGFLRSLLWQLTSQRPDLTSTILPQSGYENDADNMENDFQAMNIWTEARLRTALKQLLAKKPQHLFFCIFIDGIDEIEDNANDRKHFLEVLNDLKTAPGVKLCIASRPEQRLRVAFGTSPQIRLQDVNQKDILQATQDELSSSLKSTFPGQENEIRHLILAIALKAQGVFLWASIMVKEIHTGVQSADSLDMLHNRLKTLPSALEDLYTRMIEWLDPHYRSEMETYLQVLLARRSRIRITLLHFTLLNPEVKLHLRSRDWKYFKSQEFVNLCQKTEIRIHVCCVGLVEIAKEAKGADMSINIGIQGYQVSDEVTMRRQASGIRTVQFIHRSVQEWMVAHSDKILRGSNWILRGYIDLFDCGCDYLSLLPEFNEGENVQSSPLGVAEVFVDIMITASTTDAISGHSIAEMVGKAEQIIHDVNQRTKRIVLRRWRTGYSFSMSNMLFSNETFFRDHLELAAIFALYNTVSSSIELDRDSRESGRNLNQALISSLNGLDTLALIDRKNMQVQTRIVRFITELLCRGADPTCSVVATCNGWSFEMSLWACFVRIISGFNYAHVVREVDDVLGDVVDPESFSKAIESATIAFVAAGAECENQCFLYAIIVKTPDDAVVRAPYMMFHESTLAYLKRMIDLVESYDDDTATSAFDTTYLSGICSSLGELNVLSPGKWRATSRLPIRMNSSGPVKLAFGPQRSMRQYLFMNRGKFGSDLLDTHPKPFPTGALYSCPPFDMYSDIMEQLGEAINVPSCELTWLNAIRMSWGSPAGVHFIWPKAQVAGSVELPNGLTNLTARIKYHPKLGIKGHVTPNRVEELYNSDLLSEGEEPIGLASSFLSSNSDTSDTSSTDEFEDHRLP
ncbi:MAG: hypothetical protein M1821_000521 [Bathelium mastoideum]|nr:MAG: hypothetical protein M1821_000521 [Bathelium mastoideum]